MTAAIACDLRQVAAAVGRLYRLFEAPDTAGEEWAASLGSELRTLQSMLQPIPYREPIQEMHPETFAGLITSAIPMMQTFAAALAGDESASTELDSSGVVMVHALARLCRGSGFPLPVRIDGELAANAAKAERWIREGAEVIAAMGATGFGPGKDTPSC